MTAPIQRQLTLVGVFDDRDLADQAVSELCKAGFSERQIGVALRPDRELGNDKVSDQQDHGASIALAGLGLVQFQE